jgi:hypothetical protein
MYFPLPRGKCFFISTTFVPQKKYRFPLGRGKYIGENGPSPKVMVYKLSVYRTLLRTYTITYTFIHPVQQQNLLVVVLVQTVLYFAHCEQIICSHNIGLHSVIKKSFLRGGGGLIFYFKKK